MSTFRTALRVVAGHPIYLALYVVFLSLMGVFVVGTWALRPRARKGGYAAYEARGRGGGPRRHAAPDALVAWVSDAFELVDVADEPLALQDGVATGQVDCLVVLPEGFERELLEAAHAGDEVPALEVAYGQDVQAGALAAQAASRWVSARRGRCGARASWRQRPRSRTSRRPAWPNGPRWTCGSRGCARRCRPARHVPELLDVLRHELHCGCGWGLACGVPAPGAAASHGGGSRLARMSLCGQVAACLVLVVAVWAWTCAVALASCRGALAGTDPALVACALGSVLPLPWCRSRWRFCSRSSVSARTRSTPAATSAP